MSKRNRKHNAQQDNRGMNNFDFNNFDINQMGNLLNNINPNELAGLLNNINLNQFTSMLQGMSGNNTAASEKTAAVNDKRLELLNAIKPLMDADRARLIDTMIQIYNISRIVKK